MIKSKNSYSSFYGLYGPFESNPWNELDSEQESEQEESDEKEDNHLSLIILSLELNFILPRLPLISLIDWILLWIFNSEIFNFILFLPISFAFAVKLLEYFTDSYNLLKILGYTSFYFMLPRLFHIYHYITETSFISRIFSYFLLIGMSFLLFSIAIYNWIRFCLTISESRPLTKSKSMPILQEKAPKVKLSKAKSHYFHNTESAVPMGNWSARYY